MYIPGKGWDKDNNCYESEKEDDYDEYYNDDEFHGEHIKNEFDLKEVNDLDVLDEDVFEGDFVDPNDPNIEQIIQESKSDMKVNEKNNKEIKESKEKEGNKETKDNKKKIKKVRKKRQKKTKIKINLKRRIIINHNQRL